MATVFGMWQSLLTRTNKMSFTDKDRWLAAQDNFKTLSTLVVKQQNEMTFATSEIYASVLQIIENQMLHFIMQTNAINDGNQVQFSIDKQLKLLPKFELFVEEIHKRHTIDNCKYGAMRHLLTTTIRSPLLQLWTSIFSFLWIVAAQKPLTPAEIDHIILNIKAIVGGDEFVLFASICLCFHVFMGILHSNLVRLLERALIK